jgi:hypothetical protein
MSSTSIINARTYLQNFWKQIKCLLKGDLVKLLSAAITMNKKELKKHADHI